MRDGTAVYRLFDADDVLLYIGMTNQPQIRFWQHADVKEWWPQVASKAVAWFPDRDTAHQAEVDAIQREKPLHNVLHALTAEQEALIEAAVEAVQRSREAKARALAAKEKLWGLAAELREEGLTDIDICAALGLSRATLNRKLGSRPASPGS